MQIGLFDKFKRKASVQASAEISIGAAVKGTVVPMEQIPDPVFAEGVLGQCCGIEP